MRRACHMHSCRRFSAALAAFLLVQIPLTLAYPQRMGYDLGGKAVDPFNASAGKLLVLVFVRTDCPISNRYAPLLQSLNSTYSDKAKFWLVYPDKKENP